MDSKRDFLEATITLAFLAVFVILVLTGHATGTLAAGLIAGLGAILAYWFTRSGVSMGQGANSTPQVSPTDAAIKAAVNDALAEIGSQPAQGAGKNAAGN